MPQDVDPIDRISYAIADGSDVDWDSVRSTESDLSTQQVIDQLHRLWTMSRAARGGTWGSLEIVDRIGQGSFGTVYRAWDAKLERHVALKLLPAPPARSAAGTPIKEGRLLAKISHHNVVRVLGADEHDDQVGIWMELVPGRTLKQLLDEHGPFSAAEATLIGIDLCRALAAVHQAGLVHRDVKAQNVMREEGGRTVLMDFGAGDVAVLETGGRLAGTPLYLAPEIINGEPATPESDIYSLGVLLFHLVSGEYPVEGSTLEELRDNHAHGRRRLLSDIRPEIDASFAAVVARATAPAAADRPATAAVLERLLESVRSAQSGAAATPRRALSFRFLSTLAALTAGVSVLVSLLPGRDTHAAPQRTIAVLPIRNLTGDAAKDYLGDGLTEVLIGRLSRVRALRVSSFAAVAPYRRQRDDRRVHAELGVDLILAGAIQQDGERLRLTVQLVDAPTRHVIWAEELTRASSELFDAQAEIARMVSAQLSIDLAPDERRGLRSPSSNVAAQDAYLRGLSVAQSPVPLASMRAAAAHFRRAVELDPAFAAAWAERSIVELRLTERLTAIDRQRQTALVKAAAQRAIDLDPGLMSGYLALGTAEFYHDWNFAAAERTLRRAIALSSSSGEPHQRLAMLLAALGRTREAIALAEEGRALEPRLPIRSTTVGIAHYYARDFARAAEEMQRALTMSRGFAPAHFGLGRILSAAGQHALALEHYTAALATAPIPAYHVEYARALMAAGRSREAEDLVQELERARDAGGEELSVDNLAYIAAAAGDVDRAIVILQQAFDQRLPNVLWSAVDPRTDPLRRDERFRALLQSSGLSR